MSASIPTTTMILESFRKHKASAEKLAKPYRQLGELNEQFCGGRQWGIYSGQRRQATSDIWFDDERVPRNYINLCQGIMTTYAALLNKDRRSAFATATTPDDPEDIYTAEITNRFIDYFVQEQKTAGKVMQAVQYAFMDGTSGLKIWHDTVAGEIRWSRLTIHDYWIDPVEDWRDAKWVIFENHYDEDEVAAMWKAASLGGAPPDEQDYKNAAGDLVSGVTGHEYWVQPCMKYPRGLLAIIIGTDVVVRRDNPNIIPTEGDRTEALLPLSLMKIRNLRTSPYGITPMTDILNLQRTVNEMHARSVKLVRLVTNPQIVMPKGLADVIDITKTNTVGYDDKLKDPKNSIFAIELGGVATDIYKLRDDTRAAMYDVVGLNEVTAGGDSPTLSGRAIEAYYELDAQKNSDALKSLDDMVIDAWRLTLALVQIHYDAPRQAEIVRMDVNDLFTFSGKDIQGKNIRLEASSELERRTDVRVAKATEEAQAGTATIDDVNTAKKTAGGAIAKQAAKLAIRAYLAGGDVEINARDHSLPALKAEIERAKSQAITRGQRDEFVDLTLLEQLIASQIESEEAPAEEPAPEVTGNVTPPEPRA